MPEPNGFVVQYEKIQEVPQPQISINDSVNDVKQSIDNWLGWNFNQHLSVKTFNKQLLVKTNDQNDSNQAQKVVYAPEAKPLHIPDPFGNTQ